MLPPSILERLARLRVLALALAVAAPTAFAQAPQPTGLTALHRAGQTFVTWVEEPTAERYRVYRHDQPIDATSLPQAALLREVFVGSSEFYADRYYSSGTGLWQKRYLERYVIEDGGGELPAGTGLLVWTLAADDFAGGASGAGYYAVTSVDALGVEDVATFGTENSIGPIAEQVDLPAPVLCKVVLNGKCEIYTQFLDLRDFNPTLAAPNAYNEYYGLDPQSVAVANSLQYAFNYAIFLPIEGCEEPSGSAPVAVQLHGWGGHGVRPWSFDPHPTWCKAFRIYPIDVSNTWWLGNARYNDYRSSLLPAAGDVVVNYTEQRVLRMLRDLSRHPVYGSQVDLDRVYVHGHSMGGSGALAFALRYANVFAAAHASQPMTNYLTCGDAGGTDWRPDTEVKLGAIADGLPIEIGGPEGLADHLLEHSGTPAWDWQNHLATLAERREDDMAPLGIDHGLQDFVIEWPTQGEPTYLALDQADQCWAGVVLNSLHFTSNLSQLPVPFADGLDLVPFGSLNARRAETVPGFSEDNGNPPLPPTAAGLYNTRLDWSTSWDNWDAAPIDEPGHWQISLRALTGFAARVDITPRRLQQFAPRLGWAYRWSNERVATGLVVGTGTIKPDADELLVVKGFEVQNSGSRLSIEHTLTSATSTISLSAGGSQALDVDFGDDVAGMLYFVVGSASGTEPGFFVGGSLVSLAFDSYLLYTLGSPNSPVLSQSLGALGPGGNATCTLNVGAGSDPALAGIVLSHVAVVLEVPGAGTLLFASNPVSVELTP